MFLENHDQPRSISHFLPENADRTAGGKMLATLLLTMRGTPFIMQGEELGFVNVAWDDIGQYNGVSTRNHLRWGTPRGLCDPRTPAPGDPSPGPHCCHAWSCRKANRLRQLRWRTEKWLCFRPLESKQKSPGKIAVFPGLFCLLSPGCFLASGSAAMAAWPETAATSQDVAVPSRFSGKQAGFFAQATSAGWCPEAYGLWRRSLRAAQALIPSLTQQREASRLFTQSTIRALKTENRPGGNSPGRKTI